MSKIRKRYVIRLVLRCLVFVAFVGLLAFRPEELEILQGGNFFRRFYVLHLLWFVWVVDMIYQLVPIKDKVPLGSQKLFLQRFKPIKEKINYAALQNYIVSTTKAAYKIFLIWGGFLVVLGILYHSKILNDSMLLLISVAFYVCDLICVLIWCPFRLILRQRCCTTCRIFNWDHMMMFTPMMFIKGFYSISLLVLAFVVWCVWEIHILLFPERFWEHSNTALRCSECTDKLCTQYCQKLRRAQG